jgi:hypothetical protein
VGIKGKEGRDIGKDIYNIQPWTDPEGADWEGPQWIKIAR